MKPASLEHQASKGPSARSGAQPVTRARDLRAEPRDAGEPRTGVVRKVQPGSAGPASRPERERKRDFASGIVPRSPELARNESTELDRAKSRAWRCLEWSAVPEKAPSEPPAPRVSIAQITTQGELLRQSGPNEALPETAEFVHLISALIAQGLGYRRCRALCLRGPTSALSVAPAGATKVVGITGPLRDMSNVLRRMDLE